MIVQKNGQTRNIAESQLKAYEAKGYKQVTGGIRAGKITPEKADLIAEIGPIDGDVVTIKK